MSQRLLASDSNARTRIQSPGPAIRRPGITLSAVLLLCTVRTTSPIHRYCGQVSRDPHAHDPPTRGVSSAVAVEFRCKLDFKAFEFNHLPIAAIINDLPKTAGERWSTPERLESAKPRLR